MDLQCPNVRCKTFLVKGFIGRKGQFRCASCKMLTEINVAPIRVKTDIRLDKRLTTVSG